MNRQSFSNSTNNPFGNFNAQTSNSPLNQNFYDFNTGFRQNSQMIERQSYENKGNLIHNNINDKVLNEFIIDYYINIDSTDRSLDSYPNPCKFVVTFGGSGKQQINSINKIEKTPSGGQIIVNTKVSMPATPGPVINRKLKNVKYIKLDYIILPKTFYVIKSPIDGTYSVSNTDANKLSKYKYLILKIKEIENNKILSTNNIVGNDGTIIYPDRLLGGSENTIWISKTGFKVYNNSMLGNINKLTISILDPQGNEINVIDETIGKPVNFGQILADSTVSDEVKDSIREIQPLLEMNMSLIIGIVENELTTDVKYET